MVMIKSEKLNTDHQNHFQHGTLNLLQSIVEDKPIMSQASQACEEGAETRRLVTNLTCNTPLASDISNRDDDIVHAL